MEHRREVTDEEEIVEEKAEESPNEAQKSATFTDPTPQARDLSVRGRCRAWEKGPAISASLGAMRALVRKLDMLLLDPPRACSSESVKENMQLLKEDVEEISSCLHTLSQLEDPPQMVKCWMNEVRDLSYNLEDYIDSLHVQSAETSLAADSINTTRSHRKWFSRVRTPKKPTWDEQIVKTLSEFRIYIHNAIKRHKMYGLQFFSTLRRTLVTFVHMLPTATPYEETSDIVVNDSMNKFINSLPNDGADQQQLKVVSVLGSSCLGKTTLARVLYKRIGLQFDCRAFVRVSKNPDMKKIFQELLSQLERQQCPPQYSKDGDLINKIKNYLQGKRYLVIIDDLWSASVWDSINHAFPKVSQGSRIITTTQNEDIAFRCCHYQSEQVFEMKPLDDRHSRKLFFNRLFGSESKCPEQFKNVSNQIIALCGGLPLATIIIASLLASQPVMTEDLWQHIYESLSSLCSANPTSERTRQALNLSFNNLPQYLKTCLMYVSMYQKGYIFCQNDLVKQWIAEGFINITKGEDMEEVAKSYLHQLIGRRFIQPIRINYNNEVLSCAVHDIVHDLIAQKSAEDNFIVAIDHSEKNVAHPHKARRLSILFDDARYAKSPAYTIKSQVRSLTFVGLFECMPSITEFKLLRVLNLQLPGYGGCKGLCRDNNTVDLSVISELSRLRYLKIASHLLIKLPDYMGGLHCLETLDIIDAVVPKFGINGCLPHLLHLYLSLHDERNVENWIDKLKHLQELRLTFPSAGSSSQEENMLVLRDFISGHDKLKVIVVACDSSDKVIDGTPYATISWDDMVPPSLLERFEFSPHRSCIFLRIPPWVEKHNNLSILKIAVKELQMICVGILRGLPALTALSLYVETMPAEKIIFDKPGFSVLKYIKLRFMSGVALLKFEADAMPNVLKLKLVFNAVPQIDKYEHGIINIDHMPGLREICVKFVGAATGPEYALVSNHQSNPIINRQSSVCNSFDDKSTNQKLQTYEILKGDRDEIVEEERDDHGKESKRPVDQRILRSPVSSSRPHVPEHKKKYYIPFNTHGWMSASKRTMSSAATTGKLSTVSTRTFMASTASGGSTDDGYVEDGHILESPNLRIFTFAELRGACNNFKPETVLGEGGFGKVYKGWIDVNPAKGSAAMVVAVKKLYPESMQGMEQWQSEVNFLGTISHPNLVKLLGYCMEDNELLLVYEFMANGSLENHLFRSEIYEPLPWSLRLKILIGAARGLAFLHSSKRQIIYRDFKASNILLDSHFNPKLSDFGLAKHGPDDGESRVTTRVMGSYGYAAPEYVSTGHLYVKSDVYGFGVVLLEMLCGLRALDPSCPSEKLNLVDWAKPLLSDRRRLTQLMDTRLEGQYHARGAFRVAQLTLKCLAGEPNSRPSMKEVVEALKQIEAMKSKSKSRLTSFFNNNVFRKETTLCRINPPKARI